MMNFRKNSIFHESLSVRFTPFRLTADFYVFCGGQPPPVLLPVCQKEEPMSRLRSAFVTSLQFALAVFCMSTAVLAQAPSGDVVISANTTWPTTSYSVTSLTVQSGAVLTVGGGSTVTVANGITVSGNSSIVLQSINNTAQVNSVWAGAGVTLQAGSVQVDAGSSINADGQGYARNKGPGASIYSGQGGTYGGYGGNLAPDPTLLYGWRERDPRRQRGRIGRVRLCNDSLSDR